MEASLSTGQQEVLSKAKVLQEETQRVERKLKTLESVRVDMDDKEAALEERRRAVSERERASQVCTMHVRLRPALAMITCGL